MSTKSLIQVYAPHLNAPPGLNEEALLWALYFCERYTKGNREPRKEPAYAPGGFYYERSQAVRAAYGLWGESATCSYSNFQLLYITAMELGYPGPPLGLDSDSVALPYVVALLNKRIFEKGATTLREVADAYNSGNFKDRIVPERYIQKFARMYNRALKGDLINAHTTR